jgi:hypothetical protein
MGIANYACSAANIMTPNAPADTITPNYWIDEWSAISADQAAMFLKVGGMLQMVDAGAIVVGFIGVVMVLFGIFGICCGKKR